MKHRPISSLLNRMMIAAIIAVVLLLSSLLVIFLDFQKKQNDAYTYDIAGSLVTNIEEAIGRLESACRAYCYSGTMERFLRAQSLPNRYGAAQALDELTSWLGNSHSDIDSIILVTTEGKRFHFKNSVPSKLERTSGDYALLFELDNYERQVLLYSEDQADASRLIIRFPVFSLTVDDQYLQPIGNATFVCTTGFLKQITTRTGIGDLQVELCDKLGNAISSSKMPIGDLPRKQMVHINMEPYGFTLTASMIADKGDLLYQMVPFVIMGVLCVMLLLLSCIRSQLRRRLILPVEQLTGQLTAMGEKLEDQHLEPAEHSCHELDFLTDKMNDLLRRNEQAAHHLLRTQSRLYEAELAKRQSEINALHSQINPHFLYNTLQCIRGLSFDGKTREIAEIASAMGAIFRYSIKSPPVVLLADEIDVIRKYLHIIDIRWDERIQYRIDLPEDLVHVPVPKMVLQPLVENAIYHGLSGYMSGAELHIAAEADGDDILLRVEDNGCGISAERLDAIRILLDNALERPLAEAGEHIGIVNIHARVRCAYGNGYGLKIHSQQGQGTCVVVRIARNEADTEDADSPD